jgi:hypothetical protein
MNDCNNNSNLPTYESCWLNAIILSVLYSQYSRNFLINEIENLKTNGYMTLIKELLVSYYTNKKSIETFFKSIDPSTLLFEIFNSKEKTKIAEQHILNFYKYLGVKCAGIAYLKDFYITKEPLTFQPDVIVFFHQDLNDYVKKYLDIFTASKNPKQLTLSSKDFEGLSTYKNEITFKGITYILTSCLTTDNTRDNYHYHSVTGIYCNDTRYVYNGFYNKPKTPCSLIKYDWDINKNEKYCLNPKQCEVDVKKNIKGIDNLCFNFGTGNRTLVYIRKDKTSILNNDKYKIDTIDKETELPKVDNFTNEIDKIKSLSMIGLLDEIEKLEKKHINLTNIDITKINRNELETEILKYRLENLKEEVKLEEVKENLTELNEKDTENMLNEMEKEKESETEVETEKESEKEEIKTLGGKPKTKKEILEKINLNLKKMKKEDLISIYNKIKSN